MLEIRESQIEDIFATQLDEVKIYFRFILDANFSQKGSK
jgi:hypothetical protein